MALRAEVGAQAPGPDAGVAPVLAGPDPAPTTPGGSPARRGGAAAILIRIIASTIVASNIHLHRRTMAARATTATNDDCYSDNNDSD